MNKKQVTKYLKSKTPISSGGTMPWDSVSQARWGHSSAGKKALGSKKVAEFDAATAPGSLMGTRGSANKRGRKAMYHESSSYDHRANNPTTIQR